MTKKTEYATHKESYFCGKYFNPTGNVKNSNPTEYLNQSSVKIPASLTFTDIILNFRILLINAINSFQI